MVKAQFQPALAGAGGRVGRGGLQRTSPGVRDARLKLISKHRSEMRDARDRLASLAKTQDARQKLKKIRNLKRGKLDEKKTRNGAVTITQTVRGQVVLTTQRKARAQAQAAAVKAATGAMAPAARAGLNKAVKRVGGAGTTGGINRRVGRGGAIRLSTQTNGAAAKSGAVKAAARGGRALPTQAAANAAQTLKPLSRTIRGHMSQADKLDAELMNTHVDPVILKRTIKQSIRHAHPPGRGGAGRYPPSGMDPHRMDRMEHRMDRRRPRSRSPLAMDYEDERENRYRSLVHNRARYNDYDDPNRMDSQREDEMYQRRLMKNEDRYDRNPRTMVDRLEVGVSPLQGAKIVVSNLQSTVSQEDILELFGDIGPLKRSKIVESGTAEVVFVNRSDAIKAVEIYHNRQLDGKAMKCHLIGSSTNSADIKPFSSSTLTTNSSHPYRQHQNVSSLSRVPRPEMESIHRALFADRGDSFTTTNGFASTERPRF